MDESNLLTNEIAKALLRPAKPAASQSAEDKRAWSRKLVPARPRCDSVLDKLWDSLLMRSYDFISGSKPDAQRRMLARDARMRLDTEELRRDTLETHADHSKWKHTPYISFTSSPQNLQDIAEMRATRNRGDQSIVVVDPRIRLELGLPVLHCGEEMSYYNVKSPYEANYWSDQYLCLWEVTPVEVVGIWSWSFLQSETDWFEMIVLPAVEQHRQSRTRSDGAGAVSYREGILSGYTHASLHQRCNRPQDIDFDEADDALNSAGAVSSDDYDDAYNDSFWSDSDDSYERVCNENRTGELMKMYEDLRLD